MDESRESFHGRLVEALEHADTESRNDRADRIIWLSQHQVAYGLVAGRPETLALLEEARVCFVGGHDIAALLLALAFIEHALAGSLTSGGYGKARSMSHAIDVAKEKGLFPADILDRAGQLQKFRNPFAHLRPADDADTFGNRYRSRGVHPASVLEQDAQEAMQLMYTFFRCVVNMPVSGV